MFNADAGCAVAGRRRTSRQYRDWTTSAWVTLQKRKTKRGSCIDRTSVANRTRSRLSKTATNDVTPYGLAVKALGRTQCFSNPSGRESDNK